jgi:hypothetical protein
MQVSILDLAKVIRSKNSGPYELTLDILFKRRDDFLRLKKGRAITAAKIAKLYRVPVSHILKIVWFEPCHAVKITMKRWMPSGAPGETDIYGAQQHAPLLQLTFPVR